MASQNLNLCLGTKFRKDNGKRSSHKFSFATSLLHRPDSYISYEDFSTSAQPGLHDFKYLVTSCSSVVFLNYVMHAYFLVALHIGC